MTAPRTTARRGLEAAAALGLLALAQCGPHLDFGDANDAAPDVDRCTLVQAPVVRPLPDRMPYTVATLRGSASGAHRVEVRGSGINPQFRTVLPDGSFCVDVPVPMMGVYDFEVYAYDEAGNASCMAGHATTAIDRSAPRIAGATTCNDVDPAMCDATGTVCGMPCTPNCGTRRCGDDGCGGSCGACVLGQVCSAGACVAGPPDAGRDAAVDASMDTGTTDASTDPCRVNTRCGTCTPVAGCGWCRRLTACVSGTMSGATGTTCSGTDWIWLPSGCPDGG